MSDSLLMRNYREGGEIALFGRSLSAEERSAFDAFYAGLADTSAVDRKANDNFAKIERRAADANDRASSLWISVRNSVLTEFYAWEQVMATVVQQEPEQQVYVFPSGNDSSDALAETFPTNERQESLGGFVLDETLPDIFITPREVTPNLSIQVMTSSYRDRLLRDSGDRRAGDSG